MEQRVYMDDSLNKNADEHLEIVFKEVYDWQISDYQAIGVLLDPYTQHVFGEAAIPFANSLENLEHAIKWVTQFGELRIIPVTAADLKMVRAEFGDKPISFGAKIGNDKSDQCRAYGGTLIQAVVLAGVQVLREFSYDLLNSKRGETAH
ncbi:MULTISPECIES: hypothetical protein [unclassified Bradyrhizobium]|uniref:hypothetical protein n=1 Tax=unclassified Bradyrhizobium TaxID=2631580 RepID=UPI00339455EA